MSTDPEDARRSAPAPDPYVSPSSGTAADLDSSELNPPGVTTARRLYGLLAAAMRAEHGDELDRPVTVAEIYQDLVPYHDVRDALGLGLNADYEYAVLRLLAGEDGAARVEPEEVRSRLSAELESPNPDVGLFRQFAACDVMVSVPPLDVTMGEARAETTRPDAEPEPTFDGENPGSPAGGPAAPGAPAATPAVASETTARPCGYCGRELPAQRNVRFCPFCGGDQDRGPCESCGEPLDGDWAYCIACGTAVAAA